MGLGKDLWERLEGIDALILEGNSYANPNIHYMSGLLTSDGFIYINVGGEGVLLVNKLEKERAGEKTRVEEVLAPEDLKPEKEGKDEARYKKKSLMIAQLLESKGVNSGKIGITGRFPVDLYKELDKDYEVRVVENKVKELRERKDGEEVQEVKRAQEAAASSIRKVKEILSGAKTKEGALVFKGEALTEGDLKKAILHELVEWGCTAEDIIVASGSRSSIPHPRREDEKELEAGKPIIVDVFPVRTSSRYHGDMTRTFVKGEVSGALKEMYRAVLEARETGLAKIKPGTKASEVDDVVCEVFEKYGFSTHRKDERGPAFPHSTGHGVGLEVHERPHISDGSESELERGNVIAIEPGLYHPDVGGVRIEDVVVVQGGGHKVLTSMDTEMETV
ncbi:MAG: M24 family metallopeptidase [Candidatus Aenigmatarchaeota archaeon]